MYIRVFASDTQVGQIPEMYSEDIAVQLVFRIRRCRSRRFALCILSHSISVATGLDNLLTMNIPDPNFLQRKGEFPCAVGFQCFSNHQAGNCVSHQNNLPDVFWCNTQCPKNCFIQFNLSLIIDKILPGVSFCYPGNSMAGLFWQPGIGTVGADT